MIGFAVFLSAAAGLSWHPRLYPNTPHGLYFGEGVFAALVGASIAAWLVVLAGAIIG